MNQPSTLTVNTGDNAQGTFTFTDLQWDGPNFSGDAYNSLTKESGSVSGSEVWGAINATVLLSGQTSNIYVAAPSAIQAEYNSMNNLTLQNF